MYRRALHLLSMLAGMVSASTQFADCSIPSCINPAPKRFESESLPAHGSNTEMQGRYFRTWDAGPLGHQQTQKAGFQLRQSNLLVPKRLSASKAVQ